MPEVYTRIMTNMHQGAGIAYLKQELGRRNFHHLMVLVAGVHTCT